jgi:ketosteroid isomerase-like protein
MIRINSFLLTILLIGVCATTLSAQAVRDASMCVAETPLDGVYRINIANSDKLYSVIEGASSNVPYGDQQQFFIDLAVRLTPPDLLAIECRGSRISLGSSRAPRIEFLADGVTRNIRDAQNRVVRSRIAFERGSLTFNSSGAGDDNLSFTFTPLESGRRLRVTRRISAQELIQPVVIQTVYDKIADVARWDIYSEMPLDRQVARQGGASIDRDNGVGKTSSAPTARSRSANVESNTADTLRRALDQWIDATNRRDIEKQMSFYMPELQAFYLARNATRNSVRQEKTRAFTTAKSINIRAAEPEIIFQDGGRTAIMRFRKKYSVQNETQMRRGEVIQELRWQRAGGGWKIFSERDVKVIS